MSYEKNPKGVVLPVDSTRLELIKIKREFDRRLSNIEQKLVILQKCLEEVNQHGSYNTTRSD